MLFFLCAVAFMALLTVISDFKKSWLDSRHIA
jgi:hypothetical protein